MRYLDRLDPDPVKITMWRCLVLQIWEQQKQRVIQDTFPETGSVGYPCYNLTTYSYTIQLSGMCNCVGYHRQ